jgi:hypothetical protein
MAFEQSDKVRALAERQYVAPARREGKKRFSIPVRDVWNSLVEREGFPRQNVPQVCNALRSRKFLKPLGLEIEKVEGPPSQTSTTVVFHYRFHRAEPEVADGEAAPHRSAKDEARAAVASLRGLLRPELARYGGGEAFLRWLRTDPEKDRR